jgi:hypothetical protein
MFAFTKSFYFIHETSQMAHFNLLLTCRHTSSYVNGKIENVANTGGIIFKKNLDDFVL